MIKKVFIILFVLLIVFWLFYERVTVLNDDIHKRINDITECLGDDADYEFFRWIYEEYGESLFDKLEDICPNYDRSIWHKLTGNSYHTLKVMYANDIQNDKNIKLIDKKGDVTLSFIGDVSLADNWYIMPKYDERNNGIYGILSEEIVKILNDSDITVANNEFTISERGNAINGKMYTFRGSDKRLHIYDEMGVNLVTLANNHVYDFGDVAFEDMLNSLEKYGMPYIGAGRNSDEAMRPYYFIINGYKIGFVNATRAEKIILTPEATASSGGVFRCYDPTNMINLIKNVKQESDYVVALIHYGREDSHLLEEEQITSSKQYIDSGADMVIGTHAHVLQGIEFYNNKPIIYNLGDFIFNNESKDTGIFNVKLLNDGQMEYYFIPAYQSDEYTKKLDGEEYKRVISDMNSFSVNAYIDEDGKITEK